MESQFNTADKQMKKGLQKPVTLTFWIAPFLQKSNYVSEDAAIDKGRGLVPYHSVWKIPSLSFLS